MVNAEAPRLMRVLVNYSPAPRVVDEIELDLASGATLADALNASGFLKRYGLTLDESLHVGIWAKAKPLDTPLRDADRVEIWRGLKVDPKEARRQRYRKQPAKSQR
ncbi:MAG: RnfH family protein [Vitreoscilla sp.]|nr:RnfH family protein [Vitreoscilla sp.]MBP6674763.1 RnfH family protein [Vitreoscilla sp.]